jgi:hypothetical protein
MAPSRNLLASRGIIGGVEIAAPGAAVKKTFLLFAVGPWLDPCRLARQVKEFDG